MDKTVIGFLKNSKVARTVRATVFFLLRVFFKSLLYFSMVKRQVNQCQQEKEGGQEKDLLTLAEKLSV